MLHKLFIDDDRISPMTAAEEQAVEDDVSFAAFRIILVIGSVEDSTSMVPCSSLTKSIVINTKSFISSLPFERMKLV